MGLTRIELRDAAADFHVHIRTSDGGPDEDIVKEVPYDSSIRFPQVTHGLSLAKKAHYSWTGAPELYWIPRRGEAVAFLHGRFWENNLAYGDWETWTGPYSLDESSTVPPPHHALLAPEVEPGLLVEVRVIYDEILYSLSKRNLSLHQLDPRAFEQFIAGLFAKYGFTVRLTKQTRDGGYDVIAVKKEALGADLRVIVECKRNRPDRPVEIERMTLKKAGFNIINSYKLQIVGEQRLITDGIYSHIRHPLYLGEMTRNLGFAILFSSLYGLVVMILANIFLIFRIEIEEKMLIVEFGLKYEEYKKKTKKLIPHIY